MQAYEAMLAEALADDCARAGLPELHPLAGSVAAHQVAIRVRRAAAGIGAPAPQPVRGVPAQVLVGRLRAELALETP